MKTISLVALATLFFSSAIAQTIFSSTDLPTKVGEYSRQYANTSESDVSARIGKAGGPSRWDFSQTQGPGEEIWRLDIVSSSEGSCGAKIAEAEYAERITEESGGKQSWSYYRIIPGTGRSYYGFCDPNANPTKPFTVFNDPTIDLPENIQFGNTWKGTSDWEDLIDLGFTQSKVGFHFTSEAKVDGYGTIVLPGIGEVSALRVNEVNTYEAQELTIGLPLPTQYFRNYFWLVKGIGKAVHIVSKGETSVPAEDFGTAATVIRTFEANAFNYPPKPVSVGGLAISLKGKEIFLNWQRDPSASGYRIESTADIGAKDWSLLKETTDTFLFAPFTQADPPEFFRAFVKR